MLCGRSSITYHSYFGYHRDMLGRQGLVQVERQVLLVKTLLAEIKELELAREVLPDYIFGFLGGGVEEVRWTRRLPPPPAACRCSC